jgi:hypothetical protein
MHKRDYETIAKSLHQSKPDEGETVQDLAVYQQWVHTCACLARDLYAADANFNKDRFFAYVAKRG